MNKSIFLALTIAVSINVSAQKSNVQNAYKSLKKDKIPDGELVLLASAKHTSEKTKTSDSTKNIKLFILKGKLLNLRY